MRTRHVGIAWFVAISCAASAAPAETLTFQYSGEVQFVNAPFASIVDVGDPVFGQFTVDSETPDTDPSPNIGRYEGVFQDFTMGSYTQTAVPSQLRIGNDENFGGPELFDGYEVIHFGDDLPPIGGALTVQQSVSIFGGPDMLASTDIQPPPAIDSPAVDENYLRLGIVPEGSGVAYQYGTLLTLPEAEGAATAIGALFVIARLRRARS